MRHPVSRISRSGRALAQVGSTPPVDRLAYLSDDFSSGSTLTGNGWTIEDSSPSCSPSDTISSGEADLTISAGATGGSLWYDTNDGAFWYKTIAGACDFRARVRIRNSANTGAPATNNFRIAGLAVHDPDRGTMEYLHVGAGSGNLASSQLEWKTTDNSDSAYAYSASAAVLDYDFRIVRRASDTQVFDLYYRETGSEELRSDIGWTLLETIDRTDVNQPDRVANLGTTAVSLPDTLRWGFVVYASVSSHDIRMFVEDCAFKTTSA